MRAGPQGPSALFSTVSGLCDEQVPVAVWEDAHARLGERTTSPSPGLLAAGAALRTHHRGRSQTARDSPRAGPPQGGGTGSAASRPWPALSRPLCLSTGRNVVSARLRPAPGTVPAGHHHTAHTHTGREDPTTTRSGVPRPRKAQHKSSLEQQGLNTGWCQEIFINFTRHINSIMVKIL